MSTMPSLQNPRRYRGFVLTTAGYQKLQQGLQQLERQTQVKQNARTLAERVQLSSSEGIHPMTVRKILQCQKGVDRRSIEQVFTTLNLSLTEGDYGHTALLQDSHLSRTRKVIPMHHEVSSLGHSANHLSLEIDEILKTMMLDSSKQTMTLVSLPNGYCVIVTNH